MIYQVRDTVTARRLLQTDDLQEVSRFLLSRNPKLYEVFGLERLSMDVRWVKSGRAFLKNRGSYANTKD